MGANIISINVNEIRRKYIQFSFCLIQNWYSDVKLWAIESIIDLSFSDLTFIWNVLIRVRQPPGISTYSYIDSNNNLLHIFSKSHTFCYRCPIFRGRTEADQLKLISELCGSIDPKVWPDVEKTPSYRCSKLDKGIPRKVSFKWDKNKIASI